MLEQLRSVVHEYHHRVIPDFIENKKVKHNTSWGVDYIVSSCDILSKSDVDMVIEDMLLLREMKQYTSLGL